MSAAAYLIPLLSALIVAWRTASEETVARLTVSAPAMPFCSTMVAGTSVMARPHQSSRWSVKVLEWGAQAETIGAREGSVRVAGKGHPGNVGKQQGGDHLWGA